jgi:hypothetical protein
LHPTIPLPAPPASRRQSVPFKPPTSPTSELLPPHPRALTHTRCLSDPDTTPCTRLPRPSHSSTGSPDCSRSARAAWRASSPSRTTPAGAGAAAGARVAAGAPAGPGAGAGAAVGGAAAAAARAPPEPVGPCPVGLAALAAALSLRGRLMSAGTAGTAGAAAPRREFREGGSATGPSGWET